MLTLQRATVAACLLVGSAAPVLAQSEGQLKQFFEGKSVRVKIDMPASQQGVDVFPDASRPMDFSQYSQRLKSFGVSIRNGDSVMVTLVRVKEKVIEFQLAGGGYGTFSDDTTTSSYVAGAPKTQREKDLEKWVKDESDPARKRRLQRELDDLRNERAREDARNKTVAETASEAKKSRIAEARLHGGSRFNLRYQNGVPPGLGPDGIMRALEEYVEFPFATDRRPGPVAREEYRPAPPPAPASGDLRKGMLLADVEASLGRAEKSALRNEGTLKVVTNTYARGDQTITAEFVEGVLIKYSISSR
jgi:hypothetical protein